MKKVLNPFKNLVAWYELKKYSDEDIKNMVIMLNRVNSIDQLPVKERKNYIVVRQKLIKEAHLRGII